MKDIKRIISVIMILLLLLSTALPSTMYAYTSKEEKATSQTYLGKKDKQDKVKKNNVTKETKEPQKENTNSSTNKTNDKGKLRKSAKVQDSKSVTKQNGSLAKESVKSTQKNTTQKKTSQKATYKTKKAKNYSSDELIVKFRTNTSSEKIKTKHALKTTKKLSSIGAEVVKVPEGKNVNQVIESLKAEEAVISVQPNYKYLPSNLPNDPLFTNLWGLHNTGQEVYQPGLDDMDIDYPEAVQTLQSSSQGELVVAVIDTGTDINHPDLKDNIWSNPGEIAGNNVDDDNNGFVDDVNGWDFYHYDNTVFDQFDIDDHGTHVSGTIAASVNNGIGISGIASNVKIMPLKFLGPDGGFTSDAVLAIEYATQMGVKLSNNSWTGGAYDQFLKDAIENSNMLFVAAAGNYSLDNDTQPSYPASFDSNNILSVASINNQGSVSGFSNYGLNTVDILAPGERILSTVPKKVGFGAGAEISNGTYKVVYNGFGFENILNNREDAFNKALTFLGATPESKILLVQDDESDGGYYNFLSTYSDLLNNTGYTFDTETVSQDLDGPDASILANYDIVIWFSGYASGFNNPTLTDGDLTSLTNYLNNGGKLILSGNELLWRQESTSFVNDILGLSVVGEGQESHIKGVNNTIYNGEEYSLEEVPYADFIASNNPAISTINLEYPSEENYDNAYGFMDGTSMATPHVTGVAAMLLGQKPSMDSISAKNTIIASGDTMDSLNWAVPNGKMLNAYNALTYDPANLDNDVPGIPMDTPSVEGSLDVATDTDDVYSIYLTKGEKVTLSLSGNQGTDFDLYLYAPWTPTVQEGSGMLAFSENVASSSEKIEFVVEESGTYYIDVYAYNGSGSYVLNAESGNGAGEYEDDSTALFYEGPWTSISSTSHSGGTAKQLNTYGNFSLSFTGNEIEWIGFKGSNQGIANVYIDEKLMGTVSLYSGSSLTKQSLFKKTLPYGKHNLRIEWTGKRDPAARKSGTAINVDKVIVYENIIAPTAPTNVKVSYEESDLAPMVYWDSVEGAKGYKIYRKELSETVYTLLGTYTTDITNFTDKTATVGKTYHYTVTATGLNNLDSEKSAAFEYIYDDNAPGILITGTSVTGTVAMETDYVDVWAVKLDAGKTYSFSFNGPADTDFDYFLFEPNTNNVYSATPIRSATDGISEEYFTYPVETTGTYYIKVLRFNGEGEYSINIGYKPTVQDDDIPAAIPLSTNEVSDFLDPFDQDDVYSVELNQGDTITVNLSSPATNGADIDVYLYPPNATTTNYNSSDYVTEVAFSNHIGTSETFTYIAEVGGKYYLDVNQINGSAPYQLMLEIQKSNQETENIIENDDSSIIYSGNWSHITQSENSGSTISYSKEKGASIEYTFNGTGVKLVSKTYRDRGLADIFIDGILIDTIDLYTYNVTYKNEVFKKTDLVNSSHTIKIVVKGEKNPQSSGISVFLDSLIIVQSELPPVPTEELIEDNNESIIYSGNWTHIQQTQNSGENISYSKEKGATVEYTFKGTGVIILSKTYKDRGLADVYIDGQFIETIDLYTSSVAFQKEIFNKDNLTNNFHTIKIVVKGEKNQLSTGISVFLDSIIIKRN